MIRLVDPLNGPTWGRGTPVHSIPATSHFELARAYRWAARLFALAMLLTLAAFVPPDRSADELRVYVPNQMGASISVLDGAGNLIETVDLTALGFSAHAMPHQVVAEPDGTAWYVTLAGDGWVLAFDGSNALTAKTRVREPGMIVLDPGRDLLYVSRALGSANPPKSLAVLRPSDLELLDEPEVFIPRPHALAIDTVSGRVYTGSLGTNEIAMLDFATGDVRVTNVDGPPQAFVGLAVSPDGNTVVATTQLTNRLLVFTADEGRLDKVAAVEVEALPYDVAYSPDGESVWFPNQRAGAVTRVSARTWQIEAVLRHASFEEPHGVALSPDGRWVYVSSHGRAQRDPGAGHPAGHDMESPRANGSLAVIDARTGEVVRTTEVGRYAAALGVAGR